MENGYKRKTDSMIENKKSNPLKSDETKDDEVDFFNSVVNENGKENSEEKKKRLNNHFFLSDLALDD